MVALPESLETAVHYNLQTNIARASSLSEPPTQQLLKPSHNGYRPGAVYTRKNANGKVPLSGQNTQSTRSKTRPMTMQPRKCLHAYST